MIQPSENTVVAFLAMAQRGNVVEISQALDANPDLLNACDDFGETALIEAVKNNKTQVVELLIARNAQLEIKAGNGYAAIHWAARLGNLSILESLVAANPEIVNSTSAQNWTALHFAAESGNENMARYLIDHGADINSITTRSDGRAGDSALSIAIDRRYGAIAHLILDQEGLDVNLANAEGVTALHRAVTLQDADLVTKIITKGGDTKAVFTGIDGVERKAIDLAQSQEVKDVINSQESPLSVLTLRSGSQQFPEANFLKQMHK